MYQSRSPGFLYNILIFIIGSIILTLLINPSLFVAAKESFSNKFNTLKKSPDKPTIEVFLPNTIGMNRCSVIESSANQLGVSGEKQKKQACTYMCGNEKKEFSHYTCEIDVLRCFCFE